MQRLIWIHHHDNIRETLEGVDRLRGPSSFHFSNDQNLSLFSGWHVFVLYACYVRANLMQGWLKKPTHFCSLAQHRTHSIPACMKCTNNTTAVCICLFSSDVGSVEMWNKFSKSYQTTMFSVRIIGMKPLLNSVQLCTVREMVRTTRLNSTTGKKHMYIHFNLRYDQLQKKCKFENNPSHTIIFGVFRWSRGRVWAGDPAEQLLPEGPGGVPNGAVWGWRHGLSLWKRLQMHGPHTGRY